MTTTCAMIATACLSAVTVGGRQLNIPKAELDPGGPTFDLVKISAERFPVGKDIGLAGHAPLRVDWRKFRQMNATGISMKCRVRCLDTDRPTSTKQHFVYYRKRKDGGLASVTSWMDWPIGPADGNWHSGYWDDIRAPEGTDFVDLTVIPTRGNYRYEVEYKDVRPVSARKDEALDGSKYPLVARQIGTCGFDSEFHIASGSAQFLIFDWKYNNGCEVGKLDSSKLRLRLTLPTGIEFVAANYTTGAFEKTALADGRVAYEWATSFAPKKNWQSWYRPACLVTTSLAAGANPGTGTFAVMYEGKDVSCPFDISFKVVEPAKPRARAKRFMSGMLLGTECRMADEGLRLFAKSAVDAGVTGCFGFADSGINDKFDELGVTFRPFSPYFICNGYNVNTYPPHPEERPQNERFVADGTPAGKAVEKFGACPASIYNRKPYFMNTVMPSFRAFIKGEECGDGVTMWSPNWEPNRFYGHGCMCDSCRAEFAAFSGIAEDELKKDWPKCVMEGGRFREKAVKFRAKQHAKVVLTLHEEALKIPGMKDGFSPQIEWTDLTGGYREEPMSDEVAPEEYAGKLKWITPWGPYVVWKFSKPYFYRKGKGIETWVAAKAIREHVDRTFKNPPKLMSFPHGYQCDDWVCLPEWLALGMDSFLFNGWHANMIYYFPRGYDSRWWKVFTQSADHAGFYEDYTLDGKRVDDLTTVELVPEFVSPVERPTVYLPAATNVSLLCSSSYQLGDSRIVAALNFWERGEAFFTLKCRGLAKGGYTLVSDRQTLWTRGDKSVWSEADLEKGVFVQVGALRTKVFEIRPAGERANEDAKDRIDEADVLRRYAEMRGALKAAAEEDK